MPGSLPPRKLPEKPGTISRNLNPNSFRELESYILRDTPTPKRPRPLTDKSHVTGSDAPARETERPVRGNGRGGSDHGRSPDLGSSVQSCPLKKICLGTPQPCGLIIRVRADLLKNGQDTQPRHA